MAVLLAVRMLFALAFLGIPFSPTQHGFNVVSVVALIIGAALLLSVIRAVVRIRRVG